MFLNELKAGERAVVRSVGGEGALRQHFLDTFTLHRDGIRYCKLDD